MGKLKTRNVRPSVAGPLFWRVLHWATLVAPGTRETATLWTCVVDAMGCPLCRMHFCDVLRDRNVTSNSELTTAHGALLHGDVNARLGQAPFPAGSLSKQTEVLQRRHCAGLYYMCPREVASLLLMIAMGAELENDAPTRQEGTVLFIRALLRLLCRHVRGQDGTAWQALLRNVQRLPAPPGSKQELFLHVRNLFEGVPGVSITTLCDQLNRCAFAPQ